MLMPRIFLTLFLVSSCGPSERDAVRSAPVAEVDQAIAPPVAVQPAAQTVAALGIAYPETEPSKSAKDHNAAGLKFHRSGDYAQAIKAFQSAIDAFPTYRLARYNMACSYSLDGKVDESWALLEPLLSEDYPRHKRRIAEDSDLAPLGKSPLAATVNEVVASTGKRWQAAVAQSLPTAIHSQKQSKGRGETFNSRSTSWVGALNPETGRFLPLMDIKKQKSTFKYEDEKGLHALVDLDSMVGVLLSLRFGDFGVHDVALEVWDLRTGKLARSLFLKYGVTRLEVGTSGDALVFRVWGEGEGRWSNWWGLPLRTTEPEVKKLTINETTARVATGQVFKLGAVGSYLRVEPNEEGYELLRLHNTGKQYRVHKNNLEIGDRKIPLGRGHGASKHQSIVKSPVANQVAVVSIAVSSEDYESEYRSIIDLVNIETGVVTRLATGRGKAQALFDSLGRLHWRLGTEHSEGLGYKAL